MSKKMPWSGFKLPQMDKIREMLKGEKGRRLILILGFAGIALIFLSTLIPSCGKKDDTEAKQTTDSYDLEQRLEERLGDIVSSISGAGDAQVMVTLETGIKYIYATDNSIETQTQNDPGKSANEKYKEQREIVVVDSGSGKQALVSTEMQPAVKGVIIVCSGGSVASVKERVTRAVTTALDIPSSGVCVVPSG